MDILNYMKNGTFNISIFVELSLLKKKVYFSYETFNEFDRIIP